MTEADDVLVRAASRFIGAPFRLHGRSPATGLDCVGLVAASLEAVGRPVRAPQSYGLRNSDISAMLAHALISGFQDIDGPVRAGSILMVAPGPAQYHLLIAEHSGSFIHAHAGLRRVVRMPGPLGWPILRHWRFKTED